MSDALPAVKGVRPHRPGPPSLVAAPLSTSDMRRCDRVVDALDLYRLADTSTGTPRVPRGVCRGSRPVEKLALDLGSPSRRHQLRRSVLFRIADLIAPPDFLRGGLLAPRAAIKRSTSGSDFAVELRFEPSRSSLPDLRFRSAHRQTRTVRIARARSGLRAQLENEVAHTRGKAVGGPVSLVLRPPAIIANVF